MKLDVLILLGRYGIPRGAVSIPPGGKLPVPPTYLGKDGKEHKAVWVPVGLLCSPFATVYMPAEIDPSGWGMLVASA